jgi:hypothetical protein
VRICGVLGVVYMLGKRVCSFVSTQWKHFTYLRTYSMEQSPFWAANSQIPRIYGTRSFITAFTSARHLSLSRASSIYSIPSHPTSWRSILILSSHLRQGLPSGLFPPGFPTKTLYTPLLSPIRATCPAHLILDFVTRTILSEEYRSLSSLLCSFLSTPLLTRSS